MTVPQTKVSIPIIPQLNPHAPVAHKIADPRRLIANSAKIGTFLYKMM